jgi:hypothetical protein
MRIVPYTPEHAEEILAGRLNDGTPSITYSFADYVERYDVPSMSFTSIKNGHVVACGGVTPMWEGVGEVWLLGSDKVSENKASLARAVYDTLSSLAEHNGYWRLQGTVLANWKQGLRFARFLGFEEEGLMKKYGPDKQDYIRVARIV